MNADFFRVEFALKFGRNMDDFGRGNTEDCLPEIKVVLFDVGGVLVQLNGVPTMLRVIQFEARFDF